SEQLYAHTRILKGEADLVAVHSVPRLAGRSRILFWPSWSTSRNIVTFNRCILERRFPVSALDRLTPREGWYGEASTDLDFLVLSRAARALQGLSQSGRVAPLLVPVQYQTLSTPKSLMAYI